MGGFSGNRVYTALLAVIAILGLYVPTARAGISMDDLLLLEMNPVWDQISVDMRGAMTYNLKIKINSLPAASSVESVMTHGGDTFQLYLTADEFQLTAQGLDGTRSLSYDGMTLVAGNSYNFVFSVDQGWINAKLDDVVVMDEQYGGHDVVEDAPFNIGSADISFEQIFIYGVSFESAHYVAIGNTKHIGKLDGGVESYCQNDKSSRALYKSKKQGYNIAVSCCKDPPLSVGDGLEEDSPVTGWRYKPDSSNGKCNPGGYHPKTYQEAEDLCASHGYRLCTLSELLEDKLTKGKGCWYDAAYNWVSDACILGSGVSIDTAITVSGGAPIAEGANEANSTGNGTSSWMSMVIGAMVGVVVIGIVVAFVVMARKGKRAAEEQETEMSKAMPEHVVQDMTASSAAEPATTNGAAVEV